MESLPPGTWTESGQTPVLTESSSSRQWAYTGLGPDATCHEAETP